MAAGSAAEFTCEIYCPSASAVTVWLIIKDNITLGTSDPRFIVNKTSGSWNGSSVSTLHFNASLQDDGSTIICQIRLTDSNITSMPAVLKVIGKLHKDFKIALINRVCISEQDSTNRSDLIPEGNLTAVTSDSDTVSPIPTTPTHTATTNAGTTAGPILPELLYLILMSVILPYSTLGIC